MWYYKLIGKPRTPPLLELVAALDDAGDGAGVFTIAGTSVLEGRIGELLAGNKGNSPADVVLTPLDKLDEEPEDVEDVPLMALAACSNPPKPRVMSYVVGTCA